MVEVPPEAPDEFLEYAERLAPEILVQMRHVWRGTVDEPPTQQQLRMLKNLEDDPKQFQGQMVALEKAHAEKLEKLGPLRKQGEERIEDKGTGRVEELLCEEWEKLEGMV
jgi:hypothetical protein